MNKACGATPIWLLEGCELSRIPQGALYNEDRIIQDHGSRLNHHRYNFSKNGKSDRNCLRNYDRSHQTNAKRWDWIKQTSSWRWLILLFRGCPHTQPDPRVHLQSARAGYI